MKIGIDARVLDRKLTGTGRYLLNILNEIPKIDRINEYIVFTNNQKLLDNSFYKVVPVNNYLWPKLYAPFWLNFILPRLAKSYSIDIFFSPNILIPSILKISMKTVAVVHDIIPKIYKEQYPLLYRLYLSIFLPQTLKKADKVLTVSNYSKKDIVKYYPSSFNKIDVIYTVAENKFEPKKVTEEIKKEILRKYNLPEKYYLHVGVVEKRKNIDGLLKISDIVHSKNKDVKLVLIGRPGYGYDQIKTEIMKRASYVIYLNFVDDSDLIMIYNIASVFVFPSFYEGFGIPPLEAMQSGVPVISSNTSSLAEVVKDGGILIDPNDHAKFAKNILELIADSNLQLHWRNKGLERAKAFNIKDSITQLLKLFDELHNITV